MKIKKIIAFLTSISLMASSLIIYHVSADCNFEIHNNNIYGMPIKSYINYRNNKIQTLSLNNNKIKITDYSYDANSIKEVASHDISIDSNVPKFGGAYYSKEYFYVVTGADNPTESNSKEVYRVTKYNYDLKEVAHASVYGEDTAYPFEFGSCRMTELDGKLYINTCHEMYKSEDGFNHQSNYGFAVEESDMKVLDYPCAYASHSFDQFIDNDCQWIYQVDLSDAYKRGVNLSTFEKGTSTSIHKVVFDIQGEIGDNATGVTLGGFKLSDKNCIIVGNSVDQSNANTYDPNSNRNIFVNITSKDDIKTYDSTYKSKSKTVWLTNYSSNDRINIYKPVLLKNDDDTFVVMWYEVNTNDFSDCANIVKIDSNGNVLKRNEYKNEFLISDCQPVKISNNEFIWYTEDDFGNRKFYKMNGETLQTDPIATPEKTVIYDTTINLSASDPNKDGKVDSEDATCILIDYANRLIGKEDYTYYTTDEADANGDGTVDSEDATLILIYYANVLLNE